MTGKVDKTGKKIGLGDILSKQCYDGEREHTLITEVVFDDGEYCMKKISGSPKTPIGCLMAFPNDMPTIIGSVAETTNP